MEGVVLLRIEHLKQCRSRVAIVGVLCNLIDLVEDKHRVA